MAQRQDNRYNDFTSYVGDLHEKNKKRIRTSGIVLILLPVILGLIRWLTDSDKTVFLIIWVLCMFLVAIYLVSIEYLDHTLRRRLNDMTGSGQTSDSLVEGEKLVPPKVKEIVRNRLASDTAEDAEEGGSE